MKLRPIDKSKLAKSPQEYLALLSSDADWIARSVDDVETLRTITDGPFAKVPDDAFQEFLGSLKFSQGGLGHANYRPLMRTLSLTDFFDAFAHFGVSPPQLLDWVDKRCSSPHTCTTDQNSICTSSC